MNVLLIHSDQHRYDCVRAHGLRPDIETPHLDRLAASATVFSHAFSTIPICTPARASLLTGAWPTAHGSFCIPTSELDRAARRELPILTRLLADAGYRVGWTGKYHGELESPPGPQHGVEDFRPVWQYKNWRKEQGLPGECATHGLFGDVDAGCPENASSLAWQADQVIEQLGKFRGGPFFVRWDPPEPHLPCRPTPAFAERFADRAIPPWQSFPDPLEGKPAAQRRQLRIWGLEGWTWEQWLPVVRLYYGIIAEMDHHIGRVLDQLEALGLADDTLVIYSTDHGDYCGGHRQMDKHFNMYDDVMRVPLIIRHPGTRSAGSVCDAFASNSIDIAATILAAAGIDRPESFVGHDLVRMAADAEFRPRPHAFAQYFGTESGASSIRMLRDRRFKFVYHPTGDCHEFYDLEADPGELCNRIADPALAVEIRRMQAELWRTMKECGDRLANRWTETELCGRAPMAHEAGLGEGE